MTPQHLNLTMSSLGDEETQPRTTIQKNTKHRLLNKTQVYIN